MRLTLTYLCACLIVTWSQAQENPIFAGGDNGGFNMSCHVQPNSNPIFGGGSDFSASSFCYVNISVSVSLAGSVFLQGPYDDGIGAMRDDLRAAGFLPLDEPYTALGLSSGTGETTTPAVLGVTGVNAIIDWVVVELRDRNDNTLITDQRPALLQADGDIVSMDGVTPVQIQTNADSAFIAIRHRNHLGAMLADPVELTVGDTVEFDFSDPAQLKFGVEPMITINGVDALWSGNAVGFDDLLKYTGADNDRDAVLVAIGGSVPTVVISGYNVNDCNLDGDVKYTGADNDRDLILVNIGGSVPTLTRAAQLP